MFLRTDWRNNSAAILTSILLFATSCTTTRNDKASKDNASPDTNPANHESLYSLEVQIHPGFWPQQPNLFVCLSIEGVGDYLIPVVEQKYDGKILMMHIAMPPIPAGRKIFVNCYHDSSQLNDIINQMRQNPTKFRIEAKGACVAVPLSANVSVSGEISIPSFPLARPDPRGQAELMIPHEVAPWEVESKLNGHIAFGCKGPIGWVKLKAL